VESSLGSRVSGADALWPAAAADSETLDGDGILYFVKRASRAIGVTVARSITEVNDSNFQAEVIESGEPVLVDFWAPWCGPCRVIAPHLEELNEEQDNLRVVKLNVDDNQQTAAQYEVLSIPTLILFKNGQVAKRVIGALPKKRLEAEIAPELQAA